MSRLGMVLYYTRPQGQWPTGMPCVEILVQRNPWAGHDITSIIAKLNTIPSGINVYMRYVYSGGVSTQSTPRTQAELTDALAYLDAVLRPGVYPQLARVKGWLICNEPNLEGPTAASWTAIAANAIVIDSGGTARTGADIVFTDDSTGTHICLDINSSGSGASAGRPPSPTRGRSCCR